MNDIGTLLRGYTPKVAEIKDERKALLQELVDLTGYSLGRILARTAGMQTPRDLRFIISSMKNVKATDNKHAFNLVLYKPNH